MSIDHERMNIVGKNIFDRVVSLISRDKGYLSLSVPEQDNLILNFALSFSANAFKSVTENNRIKNKEQLANSMIRALHEELNRALNQSNKDLN